MENKRLTLGRDPQDSFNIERKQYPGRQKNATEKIVKREEKEVPYGNRDGLANKT